MSVQSARNAIVAKRPKPALATIACCAVKLIILRKRTNMLRSKINLESLERESKCSVFEVLIKRLAELGTMTRTGAGYVILDDRTLYM